ncbi:MAG: endonuclease [Deltaproteobacteria bacterium RIFCSPLOWO2_12_FULL_43_16]|nr:MAG: endonuclease [Deltaproteobacteria bacterium GWA2_43_19]OGQ09648.1 MAG: endonuclease [Deltaproteobacteria bacterium RIFCSPHIGHO2_02_FULL_43_33]OGQ43831.1 MAG: endonuclease [Deltaproteobacteria bacterium RIFCSPLOWO2_01_FULL_42_9]OGQ57478.1 MAG: endonuclease [Deltaproteobacteria bacterium RIFCSPLOWO2_12_FULL_43_16]HBR17498.1 endonuclease [Deltaproteobacteria bacterium]
MKNLTLSTNLKKTYKKLFAAFGPQHWWPGDTPFEVIVGAILTQNTAWTNVEKAIRNLKRAKLLIPKKLHDLSHDELAKLIKPAGYFNIKAKRLKHFLNYLFDNYSGSLNRMFKKRTDALRRELLQVNGIGPETADSILLYAGNHPVFVVDAYTKRIFSRHQIIKIDADYHDVQALFMKSLPHDVRMFNEYHALIVKIGKDFCRNKKPLCSKCPLM